MDRVDTIVALHRLLPPAATTALPPGPTTDPAFGDLVTAAAIVVAEPPRGAAPTQPRPTGPVQMTAASGGQADPSAGWVAAAAPPLAADDTTMVAQAPIKPHIAPLGAQTTEEERGATEGTVPREAPSQMPSPVPPSPVAPSPEPVAAQPAAPAPTPPREADPTSASRRADPPLRPPRGPEDMTPPSASGLQTRLPKAAPVTAGADRHRPALPDHHDRRARAPVARDPAGDSADTVARPDATPATAPENPSPPRGMPMPEGSAATPGIAAPAAVAEAVTHGNGVQPRPAPAAQGARSPLAPSRQDNPARAARVPKPGTPVRPVPPPANPVPEAASPHPDAAPMGDTTGPKNAPPTRSAPPRSGPSYATPDPSAFAASGDTRFHPTSTMGAVGPPPKAPAPTAQPLSGAQPTGAGVGGASGTQPAKNATPTRIFGPQRAIPDTGQRNNSPAVPAADPVPAGTVPDLSSPRPAPAPPITDTPPSAPHLPQARVAPDPALGRRHPADAMPASPASAPPKDKAAAPQAPTEPDHGTRSTAVLRQFPAPQDPVAERFHPAFAPLAAQPSAPPTIQAHAPLASTSRQGQGGSAPATPAPTPAPQDAPSGLSAPFASGDDALPPAPGRPTPLERPAPDASRSPTALDSPIPVPPSDPPHRAEVPPPAPAPDRPQQIGWQIAQRLGNQPTLPDRTAPLELTLDPPELGTVRLSVSRGQDGMVLHLHADNPDTLDLLRRHAPALSHELQRQGLENSSFSFSGQQGHRPQPELAPHRPPDQAADQTQPTPAPAAQSPVQAPRAARSGLDLRL